MVLVIILLNNSTSLHVYNVNIKIKTRPILWHIYAKHAIKENIDNVVLFKQYKMRVSTWDFSYKETL